MNFNCIPFEPKIKIWKDFSNSVYLIGDYLWSKFQQDQATFGGVRVQKIPKRGHFMDAESTQKTDPISVKLTQYVYHLNTFHLLKTEGVNRTKGDRKHTLTLISLKTVYKML